MDVAGIISYARLLAGGLSASQISDTEMVSIFNKQYKDFYKRIVQLDKNYFWDRWLADVVDGQYEYSLEQPNSATTTFGLFKPENIRIKYKSTDDFVDIFLTNRDSLDNTPEWYAVNQSKEEPIATLTDNKYIHIFPTPDEDVAEGLLFEGAKKPYDLAIDSEEGEILIDPLYHETLAYMMMPEIELRRTNFAAKNIVLQDSENEQLRALTSMGILKTKAIRCKIKDLSDLE